jgi:hypothetical protein
VLSLWILGSARHQVKDWVGVGLRINVIVRILIHHVIVDYISALKEEKKLIQRLSRYKQKNRKQET